MERRHPAGDCCRLEGGGTAGWKPALLSLAAKDLKLHVLRRYDVCASAPVVVCGAYHLTMPKTLERPATYEDLLRVPDHMVAEIIDGELFASPRPRYQHANAAGEVYRQLSNNFRHGEGGPGGWRIVFELELHLAGDVLVPDLGGWRRERLPAVDVAAFEITPDWVCEVVSSSNARHDRIRKMPTYARLGVPYAWIVDPVARGVEAYRLENGRWTLIGMYGGDDPAYIEPFEAAEIRLGDLWAL
jgi:Uma2 family endonuclease